MSQALEKPVTYVAVPPAVYRTFGFPGADDLGNMFQYKADFETEYCGARSLSESRAVNPELLTFAAWLAKYKSKIPLGWSASVALRQRSSSPRAGAALRLLAPARQMAFLSCRAQPSRSELRA